MRICKFIFFIASALSALGALLSPNFAHALTCVWQAAAPANWNTSAANWSCGRIPTLDDDVVFNGTSNQTATLIATITVGSVTITAGHTGTITQNGSLTISPNVLSGSFNQAGGTWNAGAKAMIIGGDFIKTGGTLTTTGTFTFNRASGTQIIQSNTALNTIRHATGSTVSQINALVLNGTLINTNGIFLTNGNALTTNKFTLSGGTFNGSNSSIIHNGAVVLSGSHSYIVTNATVTVGNSWSRVGTTTFSDTSGATHIFVGSVTKSIDFDGTALPLNNVIKNGTGTKIQTSALQVNGTLEVNAGTFSTAMQTLTVLGLTTVNGGTLSGTGGTKNFIGGITKSAGSITMAGAVWANTGSVTITGGPFTAPTMATYLGNFSITGGTYSGGITSNFSGAGTQTITMAPAVGSFSSVNVTGTSAISLASPLSFTGTLNHTSSGVFDLNGYVLTGGNITLVAGTIRDFPTSGTAFVNVTLTAGVFDISSAEIMVTGNWSRTGTSFISTGSTVIFSGSGTNTLAGGGAPFEHILVQKTGGSLSLNTSNSLVNSTFTLTGGTFTIPTAHTISVTGISQINGGNISMTGGTFNTNGSLNVNGGSIVATDGTINSSDVTVTTGSVAVGTATIALNGNWSVASGTFTPGTGTVIFNGSSPQSITSNGTSFATVTKSGSGTLSLNDAFISTIALNISAGTFDTGTQNVTLQNLTLSSSGNFLAGSGNKIINGNIAMNAGLTGSLQFGNATISHRGSFLRSAGTLNGGTSLLRLEGTTPVTYDTDGNNLGSVEILSTNTVTISSPFSLQGNLLLNSSANTSAGANSITVNGTTTISNGSLIHTGDANFVGGLTINGGALQSGSGSVFVGDPLALGNFVFDGGTHQMGSGAFEVRGNYNWVSGTVVPAGTLRFAKSITGPHAFTPPPVSFNNFSLQGIGDLVLNQNLSVTGSFERFSTGTFNLNNFNLSAGGLMTLSNGPTELGAGSIVANGGLTMGGGGTILSGGTGSIDVNGNVSLSGTASIAIPTGAMTVSGDISNGSSSSPQFSGNELILDGNAPQLITMSSPLIIQSLRISNSDTVTGVSYGSGTLRITSDLRVEAGSILRASAKDSTLNLTGATLHLDGELWQFGNGSYVGVSPDLDSGTLVFKGDYDNFFDEFNIFNFGNPNAFEIRVDINPTDAASGERARIISPISTVQDFIVRRGTITRTSTNTLTVGRDLIIESDGLVDNSGGGSGAITVGRDLVSSGSSVNFGSGIIDIAGDFVPSAGVFTAPSELRVGGTFDGGAGGTFNAPSGIVVLDGGNQSITGSNTFFSLSKEVSTPTPATLTLPSGITQVITNSVTLSGSAGNRLFIRASTPGNPSQVDWGPVPRTFSYLDVQDQVNTNAEVALCSPGCVDSGNNTNWVFSSVGFSFSGSSVNESTGSFTIPVDLSDVLNTTATVNYTFVDGTAVNGVDFIAANGTATFNSPSTSFSIPVTINNDNIANGNRSFVVQLSSPSSNTTTQSRIVTFTVTIFDDEVPQILSHPLTLNLSETGTSQTISVTLNNEPVSAVTLSSQASAPCTISPSVITIAPASWNIPTLFQVSATDDNARKGNRMCSVTFTANGGGVYQGIVRNVPLQILDDGITGGGVILPGFGSVFSMSLSGPSQIPVITLINPSHSQSDLMVPVPTIVREEIIRNQSSSQEISEAASNSKDVGGNFPSWQSVFDPSPESIGERKRGDKSLVGGIGGIRPNSNTEVSIKPDEKITTVLQCKPFIQGVLQRGSKDAVRVRRLQNLLNFLNNEKLPESGIFGPLTEQAVRRYQQKEFNAILKPQGLTRPTGFFGASTREVINRRACEKGYSPR